ncbi:MAG: anthranilate synthase component I family protein [Vampirovibrionales bacterium]|nr:anthranilate synthase component I family protein [Vampirovibrionales bacterium]
MRIFLNRCGMPVPSKLSETLVWQAYDVDLQRHPLFLMRLTQALSESMAYVTLLDAPLCEPSHLHQWGLAGYGNSDSIQRLDVVHQQVYLNGQAQGVRIHQANELNAVLESWLNEQTQSLDEPSDLDHLPSTSGIFAQLSYEASWLWNDKLASLSVMPQSEPAVATHRFIRYTHRLVMDYQNSVLYAITPSHDEQARIASNVKDLLQEERLTPDFAFQDFQASWLEAYTPSLSQADFEAGVEQIKSWIAAGELYQANLSVQWQRQASLEPWRLFEALTHRNPSPFAGLWKSPQGWVLSNSPERLIKQDAGVLSTRPIGGTRSRGQTAEAERLLEAELLSLEKERAEHLMLVDLERNDLGKVCTAGTVHVDELMSVERYSHVTHVVSNVQGRQAEGVSQVAILDALFPGGTITGCPKLRCLEKLAELEQTARGVYTGSMGYVDVQHQRMDFNILIRTIHLLPIKPFKYKPSDVGLKPYRICLQAGAGIVHDSAPRAEWKESLKKAKALLEAIESAL